MSISSKLKFLNTNTSSRLLSLSLLALISGSFASGCVLTRDPPKETPVPRVLYNFDSCDDLLSYAKQHATESLDEYGSLYGEGDWIDEGGNFEDGGDGAGEGETGGGDGGPQPGVDYSDTNVQEVGVDEPDLVKTDGDRIVALADGKLHHIDTKGSPLLTASLDLGGYSYGSEMFLYEDRVLLFERVEGYYYGEPEPGEGGDEGEGDEGIEPQVDLPDQVKAWLEGAWIPITRITEIDISNPAKLEIVAKLYVSGDYLSARRIDSVSRVVLRSSPIGLTFKSPWDFFYSELGWENYPETEEAWNEAWQGFVEQAKAYNAELIDASTLDNWVPHFVFEDVGSGVISEGLLLDCVDTMHAGVYSGLRMTSVLTIDLEQGLTPEGSVGLFADAAIVYASPENLYISTRAWVGGEGWQSPGWEGGDVDDGGDPGEGSTSATSASSTSAGTSEGTSEGTGMDSIGTVTESASSGGSGDMGGAQDPDASSISFRAGDEEETGLTSYLHKFAIPAGEKAIYTASGEVRGRLLNQWAMNESRGDLRVATTDQQSWDWDSNESFVTVLREEEGELMMVGQVGELGKGEEIKSVRYIGDVGYIVTFRQTDPLYTVDLSDHENPKVAGELKINGYSAYLHPLGENHMIGVGFDGTDEGQLLGVQVSLFDVSDINAPTRTHSVALGDFGWTEVAFNHKAFLNWEPTDLTVFPVESYSWDEEMGTESWFMGAAGYTITPEAGIEPLGTVTHMTDPNDPWKDGNPSLRRSLVIGDLLYTVSESGLKASSLADLSDQAWIDW